MKKILLIGIFVCAISSMLAQDKITVTFRDGTVKTGFGKSRGGGRMSKNGDVIVYKETKKSDKEFYDYKTVKRFTVHEDEFDIDYEYKIIDGTGGYGSIRLLQLLVKGNTVLYAYPLPSTVGGFATAPGANETIDLGAAGTIDLEPVGGADPGATFMSPTLYEYFLSKSESDNVVHISTGVNTHSRRFKKIAKEYFSSCPVLIERINNNYFDKEEGLQTIVEFYNANCGL